MMRPEANYPICVSKSGQINAPALKALNPNLPNGGGLPISAAVNPEIMATEMESGQHKIWEGDLSAAGLRFAVVLSRFNSFITDRLFSGCLDALRRSGATMDQIELVK